MTRLHSKKVTDEKNAFIEELFSNITHRERVIEGDLHTRARILHETFLPVYIMKHYSAGDFKSSYYNVVLTNLIESEALLILGFKNAGISSLRSAFESTCKFLYYEYHPIECKLHEEGSHTLSSVDYREFLYLFPELKDISFLARDKLEAIWSELCKYVHSDLRVVKTVSLVSDMSTFLALKEVEFQQFITLIRYTIKFILTIFFAIDPMWAKDIEKAYYDAILEAFTVEECAEIKSHLWIA